MGRLLDKNHHTMSISPVSDLPSSEMVDCRGAENADALPIDHRFGMGEIPKGDEDLGGPGA